MIDRSWPQPNAIAAAMADFRNGSLDFGKWSAFDLSACDCQSQVWMSVYAGSWSMSVCTSCGNVIEGPECEHWIYHRGHDGQWYRSEPCFEENAEKTMTRCAVCGVDVT